MNLIKKFLSNDSVDGTKIRLLNNQELRARNAANSADINLLKVNTSNALEFLTQPTFSGSPLATQSYIAANSTQILFCKAAVTNVNIDVTDPNTNSFDGFNASDTDVILLLAQTDLKENGPWIFHGVNLPMTRPSGWANTNVVQAGVMMNVSSGTNWYDTLWSLDVGPITIGTNEVHFHSRGGLKKDLSNVYQSAINASLLPATGNSVFLGDNGLEWARIYTYQLYGPAGDMQMDFTGGSLQATSGPGAGVEIHSGDLLTGVSTGSVIMKSGDNADGNTGEVSLISGVSTGGNSGDIALYVDGGNFGGAGRIRFVDGVANPTVGHVWTATSAFGHGEWMPASGGANKFFWAQAVSDVNVDVVAGHDGDPIDGVTVNGGQIILLIGQSDPIENGPWVYPGANLPLVRPEGFETSDVRTVGEVQILTYRAGVEYGNRLFYLDLGPGDTFVFTVGTSPIELASVGEFNPAAIMEEMVFAEGITGILRTFNATSGNSGSLSLLTGGSATGQSGAIEMVSGQPADDFHSGGITIQTSGVTSTSNGATSGAITLQTGGHTDGGAGGNIGGITLLTGAAVSGSISSGEINIHSGAGTGGSGSVNLGSGIASADVSGAVLISTGDAQSDTGTISVLTGNSSLSGSGSVNVTTGSGGTAGQSGSISLATGSASIGNSSGGIALLVGTADDLNLTGEITISARRTQITSGSLNLWNLSDDPTDPGALASDMYYNTTDNVIRWYNGTVWSNLGGAAFDPLNIDPELRFAEGVDGYISSYSMVTGNSNSMTITSGSATDTGASTGNMSMLSGPADDTSGQIIIASGGANSESGAVSLQSGSAGGTKSGDVLISSGGIGMNGVNSGDLSLWSGHVQDGTSGNIHIRVGPVAGGTRGRVRIEDGSEGVAGHVWMATDTTGVGAWREQSVGAWQKVTLTYADFNAAQTNPSALIATLPARTFIESLFIRVTQGFQGTGLATATYDFQVDASSQTTGDLLNPAPDPWAGNNFGIGGAVGVKFGGTTDLTLVANLDVNGDQLTDGSIDIYYRVSTLPA